MSEIDEAERIARDIREVDRRLREIDARFDESITVGLKGWAAALSTTLHQDNLNALQKPLLVQRADLVAKLKLLIEP